MPASGWSRSTPPGARSRRDNAALNGLATRPRLRGGSLAGRARPRSRRACADDSADLVLTNPPYLDSAASRGRRTPAAALAHVMPEGGLDGWIRPPPACSGRAACSSLIHRADALPALLAAAAGRFGALAALPIHPRAGEPATRVLLRGVRGSRAPFSLRAGLVLHGPDGAFTPEAEALNRGEAVLDLVTQTKKPALRPASVVPRQYRRVYQRRTQTRRGP